jgi:3-oxoisoapionate decarboxylase
MTDVPMTGRPVPGRPVPGRPMTGVPMTGIPMPGGPVPGRPVPVGFDSFSFHRWFGETSQWETPVADRWTTRDLLAAAGELGVDVLSIQTIHLPDQSPDGVAALRGELDALGVDRILAWGHRSGLEDGTNPDKLRSALLAMRTAKALGCRVFRVVCGDQYSWSAEPAARAARMARLRAPLTELAELAARLDLVVAVENHADTTMADLAGLIGSVGHDRLGVCFDVGNAARVGDDPVAAARLAAEHCFMVHLRDLKLDRASLGNPAGWWPCVPLGDGDLDIPAVLDVLLGAPRCQAWLVETSNVLPGHSEPPIVASSLAYLRHYLSQRPSRN